MNRSELIRLTEEIGFLPESRFGQNFLCDEESISRIIGLCGIDPHVKVNTITKEERRALLSCIKGVRIPLTGFRPIEEAIVTRGGVNVREVDPKTMQSKCLAGLYFAGEVLDVDAYTGGFNLQIAFSTAVLAGENAAWGE